MGGEQHPETGQLGVTVQKLLITFESLLMELGDEATAEDYLRILEAHGLHATHNPFSQTSVTFGGEPVTVGSGSFEDWGIEDGGHLLVQIQKQRDALATMVHSFDSDGDGWLTRAELEDLLGHFEPVFDEPVYVIVDQVVRMSQDATE